MTGGFGRKLTQEVVVRYRDKWLVRVQQRRDSADHIAVAELFGQQHLTPAVPSLPNTKPPKPVVPNDPLDYINSLPELKKELLARAQPEWDTGVTAQMNSACSDYIDALQGILIALTSYYPEGHFSDKDPHRFFSEQISLRFEWHLSHLEPGGSGTGGTIVSVLCNGAVKADVEEMIEDMVASLTKFGSRFDWFGWKKNWRGTNT
ncbi:MAG: hypothetical protein HQK57_09385 [Deltaproteobacteria bacterium]|nr:hypothetical protein [Deltaproteobacteria bacterium]MBF0524292.1 hypothetical protein [Deltaproteobacteria bacterium]